jgi:methylenetetrahydrofolate dehydrogenase (NADP+) / methenyltetrahydrofolate cyclohydrolase
VSAQLLDGNALAKEIKARLKDEIAGFTQEFGEAPTLAVMRIGSDESAAGYARAIEKNCKSVGVAYRGVELPDECDQPTAEGTLQALNRDDTVHGIMILEPLPAQLRLEMLVDHMDPRKDVDGVHPLNAGRLAQQKTPCFVPATPAGAIRLMEAAGVVFKGQHAVMVGRSDIVGKPMALLLLHRHCTVTIAHSRTQDLPGVCRAADILCVGIGRAEMVKADWVKPGAVVVDFGTTYTADGLKGDCDQAAVAEVAGMLTPVPGGTGPVTNAVLMSNVLQAARMVMSERYSV